jgi:uncharacterized protein (DUF433 family)
MAGTTPIVAELEDVCGGRTTVVGTRIEVRHVIGWLGCGMTAGEIAEDYGLTHAQVNACIAWTAGLIERHYGLDRDTNVITISLGPVLELHPPH